MKKSATRMIVCIGVSGSGKSTLARALSQELGWSYLEADDFHSQANIQRMKSGHPLTEAMRRPWIKSIKSELQTRAEQAQNCILAFSGLRREHRQAIRDTGFGSVDFLHLQLSPAQLEQRLHRRSDHFMPASLLESQLETFESPEVEHDVYALNGALPSAQVLSCALDRLRKIAAASNTK